MLKKLIPFVLVFAILSLLGCGNQNQIQSQETQVQETQAQGGQTQETLKWALFGMSGDLTPYEDSVNHVLLEKGLPYRISFENIQISFDGDYETYVQAYADAVKSGDYDLINCPGRQSSHDLLEVLVDSGDLLPLSDWLNNDQTGRSLKASYPDIVWEALDYQGDVYGAATLSGEYNYYLIANADVAQKYDIDVQDITFQDLEDVLRTVSDGEKKDGNNGFIVSANMPYFLQGGYEYSFCEIVCIDTGAGQLRAESILDNEDFLAHIERLNHWQKEGLLQANPANRQMVNGNFFLVGGYSYSEEAAEAKCRIEYNIPSDIPLQAVEMPEFRQPLYSINTLTGIAADSSHQEAAKEALAAIYSDGELSDALVYGEENVTYQVEDGKVTMLDDDAMSLRARRYYLGNSLLTMPSDTDSANKQEEFRSAVEDLELSKQVHRFSYSSDIHQKMDRINMWIMENSITILQGESENLEAALAEMRAQADDLGLQSVIDSMNGQV